MEQTADNTKWVNPVNRQIAIAKAKDKANAVQWGIDTAILLIGIAVIVYILSSVQISVWVTLSVVSIGLAATWLVGQRRARRAFGVLLEEELARLPDDWTDYYTILRINHDSEIEVINQAWERFRRIYREELPDKQASLPLYTMRMEEVNEAYEVLSNPRLRTAYDRLYRLKYNPPEIGLDESVRSELTEIFQSIAEEVSASKQKVGWGFPLLDRLPWRTVGLAVGSLLLVFLSGTSLAFAKPEQVLAAPFRGTAIALTKTSAGAVQLIVDIRGMAAIYEQGIISTQLQAMRLDEDLKSLTPVTMATNDMALFPSAAHPLFPRYLDRRYSQFRYTVDIHGIVTADHSWAATDAFLDVVKSELDRLEAAQ